MKEVLIPKTSKELRLQELVGDFFVLDSKSDPNHNIYTGKCSECGEEFSVHVSKELDKELDKITEEILRTKKCYNCRK